MLHAKPDRDSGWQQQPVVDVHDMHSDEPKLMLYVRASTEGVEIQCRDAKGMVVASVEVEVSRDRLLLDFHKQNESELNPRQNIAVLVKDVKPLRG